MKRLSSSITCLLCSSLSVELYHQDKRRDYYQCLQCDLVFVPPQFHLSAIDEKSEYDKHENHVEDQHYRQFLSRLSKPIFQYTLEHSSFNTKEKLEHLDFGCGPGPSLSAMFKEVGFRSHIYDLYYYNHPSVLSCSGFDKNHDHQGRYHVITMTEVLEHLSSPELELSRLWSLLRCGGVLGVMTKLVIDKAAFVNWHYKNDPTHIAFYSEACMKFLANLLGAVFIPVENDAFLFIKP